jgi:hypothetical protein
MGNFGSSAFNQDFLRREGTSDQFFAAISYPVELDGMSIWMLLFKREIPSNSN